MIEKFLYQAMLINAQIDYQQFVDGIKAGNNEKIEKTVLIKLFDEIVKGKSELEQILHKGTVLYRARRVK